jgi:hypothetical protein
MRRRVQRNGPAKPLPPYACDSWDFNPDSAMPMLCAVAKTDAGGGFVDTSSFPRGVIHLPHCKVLARSRRRKGCCTATTVVYTRFGNLD